MLQNPIRSLLGFLVPIELEILVQFGIAVNMLLAFDRDTARKMYFIPAARIKNQLTSHSGTDIRRLVLGRPYSVPESHFWYILLK